MAITCPNRAFDWTPARSNRRVDSLVLRMIERVVELRSELQPAGIAPQRKRFRQREVPIVDARPAEWEDGRVPRIALGWSRERRYVEKAANVRSLPAS